MNRPPDVSKIAAAAWPVGRLSEALQIMAGRHGLSSARPADISHVADDDALPAWLESSAAHLGLQADHMFAALDEIETLLTQGAPSLIRLSCLDGAPFLAVVEARRGSLVVVSPDGATGRVSARAVATLIRAPFERPVIDDIERMLDQMAVTGRRRARGRNAMLRDRLGSVRFRGCWMLRLPPGSTVVREARELRVAARISALMAAYLGQYVCFVGSWWLLGQAVLNGSVNHGWLVGWMLLLASIVPLRLLVTWQQGQLTVTAGAWLRRRLLRGAFHVDRQDLRRRGAGALFTVVMEAAAVDAMALSGGIAAGLALLEILGAAVVISWGASLWPVGALALWLVWAGIASAIYLQRRQCWTTQRAAMTHTLLEAMLGHRTRIAQQCPSRWHDGEDELLDRALMLGDSMDRAGVWLSTLVPRGWLVIALVSLVPAVARQAEAAPLAISLGGILLAFRALQRLGSGLTSLAGAVIAGRSVRGLARAAARREPGLLAPSATDASPASTRRDAVALAQGVSFRYRAEGPAIVSNATLTVERGARLLLEGASGSGKTTFGALLAGLERPSSGLLLVGGLDRATLGKDAWQARVVMAPQSHDNYLVGASLAFNLLMGRRWPAEASDLAEAETLCRDLGLGELLDRMPAGLDQVVGETGWQLSQGERVRVFLARALLKRPDLLILDESFSALDPENLDKAVRVVSNRQSAVLAIAHV